MIWGYHSGGYEDFCPLGYNAILAPLSTCFMLVCCLADTLNLKMEETCSFKTSVYFQLIIQRCIAESRNLQNLTQSGEKEKKENVKCKEKKYTISYLLVISGYLGTFTVGSIHSLPYVHS
jgi:hypothetical protein